MRAVVLDADGLPELAELPEPSGDGLLVIVDACGLCGSDVEKLGRAAAGTVLGHEVVGTLENGARVTVMHHVPCGACERCLAGHGSTCGEFRATRIAPGGFAQRLRASHCVPLPETGGEHDGVWVEPLACVLRGIHEMEVRTGDTAVVIGCGPIGLKYIRMLSRRGLRVIALARRAAPLELARRLGASATINVNDVPDLIAAVKDLTEDRRGPDAVVEATGNPAVWKQSLAMVRRGGVVNFFSGLPAGQFVEIEPAEIHYSEIKIISPFHHTPRFIREALEAIRRGDILAHDFVTEEIRLDELPQAFERMKSRSGEIKLAVRP